MATSTTTISSWNPSAAELATILAEMRPVIDRFADRDRRRMAEYAAASPR